MKIESHQLGSTATWPNNPALPLLVYRQVVSVGAADPAAALEQLFTRNGWTGTWRNGVFGFHHYHSNAHEVLGVASGTGEVQFGGPDGPVVSLSAGDVALLPAGTVHKRINASADFLVVGGYPAGQEDYDLIRGEGGDRERAVERIAATPLPTTDPVTGADGPVTSRWAAR